MREIRSASEGKRLDGRRVAKMSHARNRRFAIADPCKLGFMSKAPEPGKMIDEE
jgi:hypothetical protein